MRKRRWSSILSSIVCALSTGMAAGRADEAAPREPWSGTLSTGWDSLYMFRGANQLPGFAGYGSSISWTAVTLTSSPTDADALSIGTWMALGLGDSDYKEVDAYAVYTRAIGDLSLSLGYSLYAVLNAPGGLFANEWNIAGGYDLRWGTATFTPGILYAFNLGPAPGSGGYVEQASSYLELRLDADIPLVRSVVALAPWTAVGINFRYNTSDRREPPSPFVGADHVEIGIAVPIVIGQLVSVAPYVASSFQWRALLDTRPATFWGGASVTVAF